MRAAKAFLKRSRAVMIAIAIVRDLRMRWSNRRGAKRHARKSLDESLTYIGWVFDAYLTNGRLDTDALQGVRVLELGPGDNLGVALRFLARGARQVVAVERFVPVRDHEQQRRIYTTLIDRLEDEGGAALDDVVEFEQTIRFNPARLRVFEGVGIEDAVGLLEPESFDLILSHAVLEHVYDLDAAFAAMDAALAPGGLMLHKVDLGDHGLFSAGGMNPLTFLTVSDRVYRRMSRHSAKPNRRLADWYRRKTAELGYDAEILITRIVGELPEIRPYSESVNLDAHPRALEAVSEIRPRLVPRFARLADLDLATTGIFLVARKPPSEGRGAVGSVRRRAHIGLSA